MDIWTYVIFLNLVFPGLRKTEGRRLRKRDTWGYSGIQHPERQGGQGSPGYLPCGDPAIASFYSAARVPTSAQLVVALYSRVDYAALAFSKSVPLRASKPRPLTFAICCISMKSNYLVRIFT